LKTAASPTIRRAIDFVAKKTGSASFLPLGVSLLAAASNLNWPRTGSALPDDLHDFPPCHASPALHRPDCPKRRRNAAEPEDEVDGKHRPVAEVAPERLAGEVG
jgi:hypothetical protein